MLKDPRLLAGLVVALYVLLFPYHPGLRSPNELCRLWQARAIVDHGTLSINETIREYGYVGDLSVKDGRLYPSKAPLISLAAVPVYWVLKALGSPSELAQVYFSRLLITVLPSLVMFFFLRRFLSAYVSPQLATSMVAVYALGSMALNYSLHFMSHQLTAVLLFFAFFSAWKVLRGEWSERGWAAAGAFAGATVMSEYTGALGVLCLVVYVGVAVLASGVRSAERIAQLKRLVRISLWVLAGSAPFLVALMAYHQVCFGHPLTSGYKYLNDAGYQGWHVGGFLGIRFPDPSAFVSSFFSPLRGFFTLSPFLLLGVLGIWRLRAERPMFWFLVTLVLANAYFTSSFAYTSWGWCPGPRHLTPMIPFLLLPAARLIEAAKGWAPLALGLCLASVVATGLVAFVNYVPDDVSNALFGLALPLFRDGYFVPTVLSFIGLSGAISFVLLGAAVVVLAVRLLQGRSAGAWAVAGATVALHLGVLSASTRHDAADAAAVRFLESVWLTPPK